MPGLLTLPGVPKGPLLFWSTSLGAGRLGGFSCHAASSVPLPFPHPQVCPGWLAAGVNETCSFAQSPLISAVSRALAVSTPGFCCELWEGSGDGAGSQPSWVLFPALLLTYIVALVNSLPPLLCLCSPSVECR